MEEAHDLESTGSSDKSFESNKIEFGKKFSLKIIDEIISNKQIRWIGFNVERLRISLNIKLKLKTNIFLGLNIKIRNWS